MNTSHISKRSSALLAAVIAVGALGSISIYNTHAAAILDNGTVKIGVDDLAQLGVGGGNLSAIGSTTLVGVRYVNGGPEYEFTSDGCVCEGWGVRDSIAGVSGYANNAIGTAGLSLSSFTSTASTAVSTVTANGGAIKVTHDYHPSVSQFLFEATVTIQNMNEVGGANQNILYRRVMDWDIEPTNTSEFVTLGGLPAGGATAPGDNVIFTSDNGFASGDPGDPAGGSFQNINFTDEGPNDHGAIFDFDFGLLAPGESLTFTIFYGGAGNEIDSLTALGDVGAELFSIGQSNAGDVTGEPATGIFGFKGVGLPEAELPQSVPEPSTVIGGIALAGLAAGKMLRRKKA